MQYVVIMDKRGRIVLPREVRRRLNIEDEGKILVRLRSDGRVELLSLNAVKSRLERVFDEKFRDWREEDHEASKEAMEIVSKDGSG